MSPLGKFRNRDNLFSRTGFDLLSREIDTLLQNQDYQEAKQKLDSLLKKSPEHLQAKQKLGYCHLKLGRTDQAITIFKEILDSKPRDNFALLYMGLALCHEKRLEEAISYWREYFNIDQPIIQRALNVHIAFYESGSSDSPSNIIQDIEAAIQKQNKADTCF